jgi:hypothetical protein
MSAVLASSLGKRRDGAVVGTLGALGEDLTPIALTRGSSLQDRPEDASGFLLLAIEELFGEGNERIGTERQLLLSSIHVAIIIALSELVAEGQM